MQLFYSTEIHQTEALLSPEESAHAIKVLRMKINDDLVFTDGMGGLIEASIMSAAASGCILQLHKVERFEKDTADLTVAIAPTKNKTVLNGLLKKQWNLDALKSSQSGVNTASASMRVKTDGRKSQSPP